MRTNRVKEEDKSANMKLFPFGAWLCMCRLDAYQRVFSKKVEALREKGELNSVLPLQDVAADNGIL